MQHRKYFGEIKERTMADPNEFRINGDIAFMTVYDGQGNPLADIKIDAEDVEALKTRKWSYAPERCQLYSRVPTYISLKKFLLKEEGRITIDCLNGDRHDFRKINLKVREK